MSVPRELRDGTFGSMKRAAVARVAHPRLLTLAEWGDLDEDEPGELVDGALEEEEVPPVLHELVVMALGAVLVAAARRRGGMALGSEAKIAVGSRRGRKPDLSLFVPPRLPTITDSLIRVAPLLVVEVLSPRPRDARRDRIDKLSDYARAGVSNYWIVDPMLRTLEAYELDRGTGRYTCALTASTGRVRVSCLGAQRLDLDALWAASVSAKPRAKHPSARRAK